MFCIINACGIIIPHQLSFFPLTSMASQVCLLTYFIYFLYGQKSLKNTLLLLFFVFRAICVYSAHLLSWKKNAGGDLSKLSQSRADPEVLCQKVRPKMMFNTVNSHEEIRNRYRSREGVYSERYGPSGKKAKHVEWWWWDSLTPGSDFSAVRFPCCGWSNFFLVGQVFVKATPCLPAACLS